MSNSNPTSSSTLQSDYPLKIILLLLLVSITAFGFNFLFNQRPATHQLVRHFLADITTGLVAGFGARSLLRQRNWFVRMISATSGLIIGLLILGVLTDWRTGLGPLIFWRDTIDWTGMGQLLLGMSGIFLAMRAWSKPVLKTNVSTVATAPVTAEQSLPGRKSGRDIPQSGHDNAKIGPKNRTGTRAKQKRKRNTAAQSVRQELPTVRPAKNGSARTETVVIATQPALKPARTRLPDKPVVTRKQNLAAPLITTPRPQVRLSRIENHLCPYCLEPVLLRDPRGVVECEICHTLHHGDCWAIAGFCQVPHYTA